MAHPLEQRRRELARLEAHLRRTFNASETESVQALSAYDNHPADLATDTFHRELDAGLIVGLDHRLSRVRRAQQKISEGSYGLCDHCGQAIASARLGAMPEAIYCVKCEALHDRPHEAPLPDADRMPFPVGCRRNIHHAVVGRDGDAWQSAAQFGTPDPSSDLPASVDYGEAWSGFDEPVGFVEDVEAIVDENGAVLWDALRQRPRLVADSSDVQSEAD